MKFLDIRASPYITRALSLTNEVPFDISAGGFILSVGSEWGLDFRTN